ncbi:hypothetical protein O1W17_23680 [Streptomyces sp. H34-S5]|nr:hypothetical protein [Streptomyces sp. H34-AA3]MCZ4084995.1 hypothetical protein [Streptomyces sp. H34-S5]
MPEYGLAQLSGMLGTDLSGHPLPTGLTDFVDQVVPILQRRGLFRTEYTGRTLRENYGLPRPANRHARAGA